jgi:helix-turn-helix protein
MKKGWQNDKITMQRYAAGRVLVKKMKNKNHTRAEIRDLMNKLACFLNTDHAGVMDFIVECQTEKNFLNAIFTMYDVLEDAYLERVEIKYEC